jgi:hypothetical protein
MALKKPEGNPGTPGRKLGTMEKKQVTDYLNSIAKKKIDELMRADNKAIETKVSELKLEFMNNQLIKRTLELYREYDELATTVNNEWNEKVKGLRQPREFHSTVDVICSGRLSDNFFRELARLRIKSTNRGKAEEVEQMRSDIEGRVIFSDMNGLKSVIEDFKKL